MIMRLYLVPLWLRFWHWANALCFLALLLTGISLHFGSVKTPLIPFELAQTIHNVAGISMAVLWVLLVLFNALTGNWRQFIPNLKTFLPRLLKQQMFYGIDIFKGADHPFPKTKEAKFNPLQQVTYLCVVYGLLPILILTGMLFLFPEYAPDQIFGMGGLWPIAVTHYLIGLFLSAFLVVHVYMITIGETLLSELKMMITGWHEEHEAEPKQTEKDHV